MEKINKENIIKFVKENKIKTGLIGGAGIVALILILVFLWALWMNNTVREMSGAEAINGNFLEMEQAMPVSKSARGMVAADSSYFPPQTLEGKYNPENERKVVKTGNLSLVVKNIENAKNKIEQITTNFKGFVVTSNFSENENYKYYNGDRKLASLSKSGYFEIKVPSVDFEKAFSEFKKVALKVNSESTSGRDVTEYFSDLKTQLKNKNAEVEQYRNILRKAEKIEDVLKVTQYLNKAQVEAERLQGRMNLLSNQIALSSIRIDIISESDVELFGVVWSPIGELKEGFSDMVTGLKDFANMVIAFLFKLPIYILYIGGIILGLRIIWKIGVFLKKKVWK